MEKDSRVAKQREKLDNAETLQRAACPACIEKRVHTEDEWKQNHPHRHHGKGDGKVWTGPLAAYFAGENKEK